MYQRQRKKNKEVTLSDIVENEIKFNGLRQGFSKALNKFSRNQDYEEIDTRLASGWYVDSLENNKKKKYRTEKVSFKISKKI